MKDQQPLSAGGFLRDAGVVRAAPVFVSTVKIRHAGYNAACSTDESFYHWLRDLMARRILPPSVST